MLDVIDVHVCTPDLSSPDSERLWTWSLDTPSPGDRFDTHVLEIGGWILERVATVVSVHAVHDGISLRSVSLSIDRDDVVAEYRALDPAVRCGFWMHVGVLSLPEDFTIQIEAICDDGTRIIIGRILARHTVLPVNTSERIQPILLTSMGRSGTTYLMGLLAHHPQILVHRVYPFETRAAGYWLHMLRVLAEPDNHAQSSDPDTFHEDIWRIGHFPYYEALSRTPAYEAFLGDAYVRSIAEFCVSAIDRFYKTVGVVQGASSTKYFAEKTHYGHLPVLARNLYQDAREIVLVRDFRDMICSMLAFNTKRGTASFGRSAVASDQAFVRRVCSDIRRLADVCHDRRRRVHLMRYEDLVLRPAETLSSLLEYLGLDDSSSTIEGMLRQSSEDSREFEQHRTTTDVRASIGRWQRDLSPLFVEVCQEALGDLLDELGYGVAAPTAQRPDRLSEDALGESTAGAMARS